MKDNSSISEHDIRKYINPETEKYSVWVYGDGEDLKVYEKEMPNTTEIWFRFNKFSHIYWKLFEDECIDEIHNALFYNFTKLKRFMLTRLLCETNFSDIEISYDSNGMLSKESYEQVMSLHPRILRCLMNKIDVFPRKMKKNEEKEFEKQCHKLFGKGEGVQNPHPYITTYCNLVAFWDKFGLNYFDIMSLPQDLFIILKRVLSMESNSKSEEITSMKASSQGTGRRGSRAMRF